MLAKMDETACEHQYERRFVWSDGDRVEVSWCPRCSGAWCGAVVDPEWKLIAPAWQVLDKAGHLQARSSDVLDGGQE
jgi:hypothetical protein